MHRSQRPAHGDTNGFARCLLHDQVVHLELGIREALQSGCIPLSHSLEAVAQVMTGTLKAHCAIVMLLPARQSLECPQALFVGGHHRCCQSSLATLEIFTAPARDEILRSHCSISIAVVDHALGLFCRIDAQLNRDATVVPNQVLIDDLIRLADAICKGQHGDGLWGLRRWTEETGAGLVSRRTYTVRGVKGALVPFSNDHIIGE
mmetsp:Transcript_21058/g.49459  ORF Transcript_21058/g.49459 Transcript_21058/m.49459 type:complete len:205 (+) Transcript_21058:329-943(+)